MPHAVHDAAYWRDYRARTKVRPAEPPSWYELGQAMPAAMVEALLEGIAKCSPEPLREWLRIPRVSEHRFRSNPYTRSDPFRTAFRGFRTPRGVVP